jgi:hypothetical protein
MVMKRRVHKDLGEADCGLFEGSISALALRNRKTTTNFRKDSGQPLKEWNLDHIPVGSHFTGCV